MGFRIRQLPRVSLVPIGLFAVGVLSVVGYVRFTQSGAPMATPAALATPQAAIPSPRKDEVASVVPASSTPEALPVAKEIAAPDSVSTLVAQATGTDAAKRAAAIAALGTAPKEQALPVLAQLLDTAGDSDLALALSSLSTLARKQGDEDNRVRSVLRRVVSHSSDETVVQAAQQTLDEIDSDLSKVASAGRGSRG